MSSKLIDITSELIAFESLSGEERPAMEYLENILAVQGWQLKRIEVDKDRFNILAGDSPQILLTTHIDVVPGTPEQFVARIEGGKLYGRGACDAKGIAAAMIIAANALRKDGVDNVGLLFVVSEESDGAGAIAASKALSGMNIKAIVNGEPTLNKLTAAQMGALEMVISINGKSCHSGYPELGIDANRKLIEIAQKLYSIDTGSDLLLGQGSINIGVIAGGSAANVISDGASMSVLVRCPGQTAAVEKQVLAVIKGRAEIAFGYRVEPSFMYVPEGFESCIVAYGSDASFFAGMGARILQCGPGSILQAHTDSEFIELSQLEEGVNRYRQIVNKLNEDI